MREGREKVESLAAVAERMGLLLSGLSRIERGETYFPSDELPAFLAGYRVTLDDFAAAERAHRRAMKTAA